MRGKAWKVGHVRGKAWKVGHVWWCQGDRGFTLGRPELIIPLHCPINSHELYLLLSHIQPIILKISRPFLPLGGGLRSTTRFWVQSECLGVFGLSSKETVRVQLSLSVIIDSLNSLLALWQTSLTPLPINDAIF